MAHSFNWSVAKVHVCAQLKKIAFFFKIKISRVILETSLSPLLVLTAPLIVVTTRKRRRRQVSVRRPMNKHMMMGSPMMHLLIMVAGKYSA
jgi:hypothetical protein